MADRGRALKMAYSTTELVVKTERSELEANLLVASGEAAANRFVAAGGALIVAPFDISIGRCGVMQDPWGNRLVVLDQSQGRLLVDTSRGLHIGAACGVQTQ